MVVTALRCKLTFHNFDMRTGNLSNHDTVAQLNIILVEDLVIGSSISDGS